MGAKVPGSELARVLLELLLRGANWPGIEKARYHGRDVPVLWSPVLTEHAVYF